MSRLRPLLVVMAVVIGFGSQIPASGLTTQNLDYHGGPVMKVTTNYAIFWEPPRLQSGQKTHVSRRYNKLVMRYFADVGGHGLYNNNTQYYEMRKGRQEFIENVSSFGGAWLDTSAYPASGCFDSYTPGGCLSDHQIQAEVAKAMRVNGWTAGRHHLIFVFTSYGEGSCVNHRLIPGCAFRWYCAWHNYFRAGGTTVFYTNQPYPGTNPSMCIIPPASPNDDPDADANLDLISHEQMESVTDPTYRAWWTGDANTGEIGDLCAASFGKLDEDGGKANQVWNGHYYILQEEWSNAAGRCVQHGP